MKVTAMPMVKTFLLLALAVAVVATNGCATNTASRQHDRDLVAAVSAVLKYVQHDGKPVKLVRGSSIGDAQWAVLGKTTLIAVAPHPDSENSLAAGEFRIDEIDMRSDSAHIAGVLGPIPKRKPGVILLACGTGYKLWVGREGSGWRVLDASLLVC